MRLRRLSAYAVGCCLVAVGLVAAPQRAQAADPTPIAEIQGTGPTSPKAGQVVTTTASRVTAVYGQGSTAEFRGFVIQTPGTGGARRDLATASDAVFVFLGTQTLDVAIGDVVSVTGTAGEFSGLTQIGGAVTVTTVTGDFPTVRPLTGLRWADTAAQRENFESMLYASDERFTVSDTFPLLRFGELGRPAPSSRCSRPRSLGRAAPGRARGRNATWPSGSTWTTAPTAASPGRRRWRPARCRTCRSGWRWPSVTGCA
jgi:predicted extracellular nuclease